jgi:L-ribulose-5-phosphate 3-epimerase
MNTLQLSRRHFLAGTALAAASLPLVGSAADPSLPNYPVGGCDWMILKRQRLGAFPLAKEIGANGVEVDMGGLGDRDTFDSQLGKPEVRAQFLAAARDNNLQICSLARSGFYAQSFAERPTYERMVGDCLDTAQQLGVKVVYLPLGVRGDLVQHPELRPAIIERLRKLAPRAAAAGVAIGLETALDAAGEVALLEEIGSPAVKIYFNFANPLQADRDLHAELRTLAADRICQIHATDQDGVVLEQNKRLDLPAVRQTLGDIGWRGWLVLERSRDANDAHNVRKNFGANAAYVKRVFGG